MEQYEKLKTLADGLSGSMKMFVDHEKNRRSGHLSFFLLVLLKSFCLLFFKYRLIISYKKRNAKYIKPIGYKYSTFYSILLL